ncbi:cupin domain-containing protein [Gemmatimonadota bacterium]
METQLNQYRVDFETVLWQIPMPGVRHKFVNRDNVKLRLVEYAKEMEPHWCSRGHVGMVLEGRFEIRYDTVTEVYKPGDGVLIPSGEQHRHMGVVLTDTVLCVFVEET